MKMKVMRWASLTVPAAAGVALTQVAAAKVEFKNAAETRKWMDEQTARLREVLTALGLTKRGS